MEYPRSTVKDAGAECWQLDDNVMRLRRWALDGGQVFPQRSAEGLVVGSGEASWLRIDDDRGRVSRRHAVISGGDGKWVLEDAGSTNGIMADGVTRTMVELEAGMELWLGGVTLVAESLRSIALRAFLGRLLGWSPERMEDVDLALRAIRIAKKRQGALVLCGTDKLALLARALHHRVLGADRPFVMCDPRRERVDESIRAALNYQSGMEALPAARDGSLCIWTRRPPPDVAEMRRALKNPDTRVQLIVCGTEPREAEIFGVAPIAVPSLSSRTKDLPRIIEEYAHEITADLGLERSSFPRGDQSWVLHQSSGSLPEIEQAILRILRLRQVDGDRTVAADQLGMSKSYLNKWIKSRNPPIPMKGKSLKADE